MRIWIDYDFPVLMNAYGSEKRMCMALGVRKLDDITGEIEGLFKLLSAPKESMVERLKHRHTAEPYISTRGWTRGRRR